MDRFAIIGKSIVENSNLNKELVELTDNDVKITNKFIENISSIEDNQRLYKHLQLVSKFAKKIGTELKLQDPEKYNDLKLPELEILGLFHDTGRFFTHRWLRNDLVGKHFLKKIGIKQSLIDNLPDEREYLDKNKDSIIEEMSLTQKIIEIADICGKRKDDGGISTFEETMNYHYNSRKNYQDVIKQKSIWPSEKKLNPDLIDISGQVYEKIYDDFKTLGIDLEEIRKDILEEEINFLHSQISQQFKHQNRWPKN